MISYSPFCRILQESDNCAGRILQESDNGARTGALLASFMSSMSGGSGQQMLQSAGGAHVGRVAAP